MKWTVLCDSSTNEIDVETVKPKQYLFSIYLIIEYICTLFVNHCITNKEPMHLLE